LQEEFIVIGKIIDYCLLSRYISDTYMRRHIRH